MPASTSISERALVIVARDPAQQGFRVLVLDGTTPAETREQRIAAFQRGLLVLRDRHDRLSATVRVRTLVVVAALVAVALLAMLAAKGTSVLRSVYVINRGYEDLAERLNALGAQIETFRDI